MKPHQATEIDLVNVTRSKKWFGWAAWVCGVIVILPPMIGIVGTIVGMVGAFSTLQQTGNADPAALPGDISFALLTTLWGLVSSALALIPFIVFLVLFLKQRRIIREISRRE